MPEIKLIDMRGGQTRTVQQIVDLPPDPADRQHLTDDPNTTRAQWRALIHDATFAVRYAAASSRQIPPEMLVLMVVDGHPFVRAAVAHNPRTPDYALKALIKDADPKVREVAQTTQARRRATQNHGPELIR